MRYLLDTQILIWFYEGNPQLSEKIINIIEEEGNSLYFSIASFWEMSIKVGNGKLALSNGLEKWLENVKNDEIEILLVQPNHILTLASLPSPHKDPFDRIIIAQAITENLTLISSDAIFKEYPVLLINV